MSRIGRLPVTVPKGVDVKLEGRTVSVKGPKGELVRTFHPAVEISREDATLAVKRKDETHQSRALHGLSRTLLANIVHGMTVGYARYPESIGTGFRSLL